MKLDQMTRDERSLLLFLECRAVDNNGRVQMAHMNADDKALAEKWNAAGFISFGRIASEDLSQYGSHWVRLSDEAFALAHQERKARSVRGWSARNWKTTEEKRAASVASAGLATSPNRLICSW